MDERKYWDRRKTRPCSSCGAPRGCLWVDTHWVCRCGDEWDRDHDPIKYEAPGDLMEANQ